MPKTCRVTWQWNKIDCKQLHRVGYLKVPLKPQSMFKYKSYFLGCKGSYLGGFY